jgi:hypothetical protein
MRKIICLHLEEQNLNEIILEECSRHSLLVEPRDDREVLLDVSTFKRVGEIIKQLAAFLQKQNAGSGWLGVGSNPLIASCAACRQSLPDSTAGRKSYNLLSLGSILVVRVLPGQEKEFIASLPLEEFTPLLAKDRLKLMRLGYSRVGDIAGLSPQRIGQLLRCNAMPLWQNCQGIDYTPVRGTYPPDRLTCSILLPSCKDRTGLKLALEQISIELEEKMERQHKACRKLRLEVLGARESISRERVLGYACYKASNLARVLLELLPETGLPLPVEELRVYLDKLEQLEMEMPDLFTWRGRYQEEQRRCQLQEVIHNLLQRFPRSIQLGSKIERREQVLAFWDPWRFPAENRRKAGNEDGKISTAPGSM